MALRNEYSAAAAAPGTPTNNGSDFGNVERKFLSNFIQARTLIFVHHQHMVDVFVCDYFFVVFSSVLACRSSSHIVLVVDYGSSNNLRLMPLIATTSRLWVNQV